MIKLKELEVSDITQIGEKVLYCYERSEAYLTELKAEFPMLAERISGIVDDNQRNQGVFLWKGQSIPVKSSAWLFRIDWSESVLLITSDYYREAYERLCDLMSETGREETVYYYVSKETKIEMEYRDRYRDAELQNILLFRSGPHASSYVKGMDFSDNARALFEYMLKEHLNETYKLVWIVKDPSAFSHIAQKNENVSFVSYDWSVAEEMEKRDAYYKALCLAKYIFMTDAYGFARNARKDQIRVQLWHGCGFKTRVNFVRCEKRYEYTTVISDLYAKIHQDIYGLRPEQMLVTGYAKEDWLFHPISEIWKILSIPRAEKYIFWLPTFRMAKDGLDQLNEYELEGQTGLPIVDTFERLGELDRLLDDLKIVLIIKLHPFQNQNSIKKIDMKHIVLVDNQLLVKKDIQINQILGCADGLISDYSSAAVDYMLLDRPIGFTLEDMEEYKRSRGFVFDNIREWLPGAELFSFVDFCSFVREIGTGIDSTREKRQRLKKVMHKYNDDQNCRRIVEALQISVTDNREEN